MKTKLLVALAVIGVISSIVSVVVYTKKPKSNPPLKVSYNPYEKGIYATGIIESYQSHGANIAIVPEVSGRVIEIYVKEGDQVKAGDPLFKIDDSVQRELVAQLEAQRNANYHALEKLKAEPRKENLEVSLAQMEYAKAVMEDKKLQFEKLQRAYQLNPKSVSQDDLDKARKAYEVAKKSYDVSAKQYHLVKAGSWEYEVKHQESLYLASQKAYEGAIKTLEKYTVRAPVDGVIVKIQVALGSYLSPQGAYDIYTKSYGPAVVMTSHGEYMQVRCYIDEILVPQLPDEKNMVATMFLRGTDIKIPLEYVKMEPFVVPKTQLSSGKTERVDVRVLPLIFRFKRPENQRIYPGQLVDVYISENTKERASKNEN